MDVQRLLLTSSLAGICQRSVVEGRNGALVLFCVRNLRTVEENAVKGRSACSCRVRLKLAA